jgi:hypothetical protein
MTTAEILQALALVVAPSGAAWAGVKLALNGTRKDIHAVATKVDAVEGKVDRTREEVAYLKGYVMGVVPPLPRHGS